MKIIDFLKVAVLPRREHHFWRWGCDLDGLWNHQNRWKVVSERVKRERYKTTWKIRKFNEVCKRLTLTKCRIYRTDLMFSVFAPHYFQENMRYQNDAIWGPGLIFDRQKTCQNNSFLAASEIAFRIVKNNGFRRFWELRGHQKRNEKHMSFWNNKSSKKQFGK